MIRDLVRGLLNPFFKIDSDIIINKDGHSYIRMTSFMDSATNPCIVVPFNGSEITIIARKLTGTQRRACGDFSLIQTVEDKRSSNNSKMSFKQMCDYSRLQHEIIKKSLVSPTYDELMNLNEFDILRLEVEKELKELEPIINAMEKGTEKNKLKNDYYLLEMNSKYLLPEDFITYIMAFALGTAESDLKDITSEMLYEAAILAKKSGGRPSDYMPGSFLDHHKIDIDKRAWVEFANKEMNKNNNKRGA